MSPENQSSEINENVQFFTKKELQEIREQAAANYKQEQSSPPGSVVESYDDLFSEDYESPVNVEDAAVRHIETEDEKMSRERETSDALQAAYDAYKRIEMQ